MKKRRNYATLSLALLFFAILGLNIWVIKSTAHTNTVIDKTVIEHAQLEFFVPNKRILMQATILDPAGIADARLYFGTSKDAKNLVFSPMKHQGGSYVGIIPAPSSRTEKIFYCFLAVNHNGDVTKTGLFELHVNKNIGFVPTWQGDFNEYGKTLILGKEPLPTVIASEAKQSLSLEGFTDSIIVNSVKPDERYFAAKKVQRVAGLSTTDGGDVEPADEAGEVKGGWSKNKKIAVIGGVLGAAAIGGGIAALSGGGGGGGGGGGSPTPENCTDGIDNDGDGKIDCADTDCVNPPCGPEIGPERCSDGIDNDGDGLVDCNDPDCQVDNDGDGVKAPPCGNDCDDNDRNNFPGNAENCTDSKDNDCDNLVDCADPDCQVDADGDGVKAPPCGNDCNDNDRNNFPGNAENCSDGKDNDCDGDADGADSECVVNVPDQSVEDGSIEFEPNSGVVGDSVSVSICLNEAQGLASGWHIRVNIDGEVKEFQVCNTLGRCALTCDLGEILKFSSTNHTVRVRVNWETGPVTLFERSLPLEFKD